MCWVSQQSFGSHFSTNNERYFYLTIATLLFAIGTLITWLHIVQLWLCCNCYVMTHVTLYLVIQHYIVHIILFLNCYFISHNMTRSCDVTLYPTTATFFCNYFVSHNVTFYLATATITHYFSLLGINGLPSNPVQSTNFPITHTNWKSMTPKPVLNSLGNEVNQSGW